ALDELAHRAGRLPEVPSWEPPRRPRAEPRLAPTICRDSQGLNAYVDSCARALWEPAGRSILRWLTQDRGLPEQVLKINKIGADLGPRRQPRPDGMSRTGGAVLPVIAGGRAIYAQVRVPHPRPDRKSTR